MNNHLLAFHVPFVDQTVVLVVIVVVGVGGIAMGLALLMNKMSKK
jgi:hypothetical protein